MDLKPLKVAELNQYIKRLLTSDPILYNINVEGEISNYKYHFSGHMYFTLKDDKSKIKCVFFNNDNRQMNLIPKDGMKVILTGYVSVFEKDGSYQLYVKSMKQKGIGELFEKFENLKKKLDKEGLFDQTYKKSIPFLPKKIGVVTSSTGAAIRDIITVISRRMPTADIIVYPVLVQGDKAHIEICEGISYFNLRDDIDTIIIGRGGGSIEELWAFNEEDVARAIFNSRIPIISAVGHETDFTIADFVSDLRAPTPSAAGELSVPFTEELHYKLNSNFKKLCSSYVSLINKKKNKLEVINEKILFNSPLYRLNDDKQRIDVIFKDLQRGFEQSYQRSRNKLDSLGNKLDVLSPLSVLCRGYSITSDKTGQIIRSVNQVKIGEKLVIILKDGKIEVKVINQ